MVAKFKGRTNLDTLPVYAIAFKLADGRILELKKNISEYVVDDEYFEMRWKGCHIDAPKGSDFSLSASMFRDAEIIGVILKEDAPKHFEIKIDSWTVVNQ